MEWLSTVTAILGVLGTLGAGSTLFYANSMKNTISILKEERDAQREQNARLEADLKVMEAKCAAEAEKTKLLQDMVTQSPQIKKLAQTTARQHKELIDKLSEVEKAAKR